MTLHSAIGATGWMALPAQYRYYFSLGYNDKANNAPWPVDYETWTLVFQKVYEDGRAFFAEARANGFPVAAGERGNLCREGQRLMSSYREGSKAAPEYLKLMQYCRTVEQQGNSPVPAPTKEVIY